MKDPNQHELENGRPKPIRPLNELEADPPSQIQSPHAVMADSKGGPQLLHVELGFGKSAVVILWLSALISAAAIVAMVFMIETLNNTRAYVNVLQYDLMDLRAKTGFAHENEELPQQTLEGEGE